MQMVGSGDRSGQVQAPNTQHPQQVATNFQQTCGNWLGMDLRHTQYPPPPPLAPPPQVLAPIIYPRVLAPCSDSININEELMACYINHVVPGETRFLREVV